MRKILLTSISILITLVLFQNCSPSFVSTGDYYNIEELPSTPSAPVISNSCNSKAEVPKRRMRLLSKKEYTNTVKSLFGKLPNGFTESPLEGIYEGYTNHSDDLIMNESIAKVFFDNSIIIAKEVLAQNMFEVKACLNNQELCDVNLRKLLTLAFRGYPIDSINPNKYLQLYNEQTAILGDKLESLTLALAAIFQSPEFVYRSELGVDDGNGFTTLKPYELANQLSYLFTHSPPDEELMRDLKDKKFFVGSPAVKEHALRLSGEDNTLNIFIENWLEMGSLEYKNKKFQLPGTENKKVLDSLSAELSLVTKKIINQNFNYKDMHLLDSTFVNSHNSKIYSDKPQATEKFAEVSLANRKGLLNMAPFLVAHSNPDNSNPIHRGAFILKKIMCGELNFPENIGELGEVLEGEQFTTRQIAEASTEKSGCIHCHVSFNGYGFALESFNEWGTYRTKEAGQDINTETTMRVGGKPVHMKNSIGLAEYVSTSSEAQSCFSKNILTYSLSMKDPDACHTQKISNSLASGTSIKEIFLEIINSDQFNKRKK